MNSGQRRFLHAKGYRFIERNLRISLGELDLVAEDVGVLASIEMKGRTTEAFGGALPKVDCCKRAKCVSVAA